MSIHAALTHATRYRYDRPITLGPQVIRLRPAPHSRTPILSYSLKVEPTPHFLNWQQDPQGNFLARVVFPERVTHFDVTVDLVADMAVVNPFDFFLEPQAETFPFDYDPNLAAELAPFRKVSAPGPLLDAWLAAVPREKMRTVDFLVMLNQRLQSEIGYIVRLEAGVWAPEQVLERKQGSCRDSGWLLVNILRHLGFAARFCSGYLIQLVPDVKPLDGPAGPAADFTDLHAWCEVYLPGAGWVGLDPTSGLFAGEGHIPLAATPEPASAAPIEGLVETAETSFDFAMNVTRIAETPRVTRPYTAAQWQGIDALGRQVDAALSRGQVRLSMGGEPTFVSATDQESAEWNTDALGPTKRRMAGRLLRRLAPKWAPGHALQYTQGKHYPGEQLPRWALYCHWRADGEPIWTDPALLASDDDTDDADASVAAGFAAKLAERLQVDPGFGIGAYEDIHYYLWRERRLPANVVVEDSKLRDPLERARLARVFEQGLGSSVGTVLPLRRVVSNGSRRWQSGRWFFRPGELFLIPGDSPIGLRLPLDSLPWYEPDGTAPLAERDPFAPTEDLPLHAQLRRERVRAPLAPIELRPQPQPAPDLATMAEPDIVRTALCVEPRNGMLHVFLPPVFAIEDWLDLLAAIEATAEEAGRKVFLEGYLPPSDPRVPHFSVTPDPGVIEVNIHPVHGWGEASQRTRELYEEARAVGLATEKFMLDGRHTGTGGGNHVVMGGATPADSPFLRRPDLIRSLLAFWHNHPSLSFAFSGLFIGPTSQHPRVDEARMDALYELELAFRHVTAGQETPPWLTDRLLRNLLVDMTGNTHRTEFCIDKMFDPAGPGGRRGLVEFRAFEMPPHAEISLAQQLLLRAALAAFWARPYTHDLVRWGTRIHDDFMLRHFCEADLAGALEEISDHGFAFDPNWFAPHLEFRFPLIGSIAQRGMQLDLRNALEPWHVMGEEAAAGGTVRYVDSSVERIEAKVSGWVTERYALGCNGFEVPLAPTGTAGEYVAGVRFKAWNPPSSLHPTIRPQGPLMFDIFDRWTGRSIGGATYHVAHPGGRSHDTFPVNANEAEARRRARFQPFGHSPGNRAAVPVPLPAREHPRTLDLRRGA
jgi:uncharacterized protein (DUF2126 family)/transglutaminase-like putative cysteine protease